MEQLNFQIYFNFNIEVTFISWKARVPIDFWKSTKQPYISETRRKISVIELIGFQNICFRLLVNIMEGSFILLRKNTEQPSNSRTRKTIAVTSCDNWISKYILRPIIGGGGSNKQPYISDKNHIRIFSFIYCTCNQVYIF